MQGPKPDNQPVAAERLLATMASELPTLYRLVAFLGDRDTAADEVLEWLGVLAAHPPRPVDAGRERAFLLRSLLSLLGADVGGARERARARELPDLLPRSPMPSRDTVLGEGDFARVDDALRELDPPTRAAVLLVVQEGLSIEDAARIQGGTRRAFARRYAHGLAALEEETIEVLMGRFPGSA